MSGVRLCVYEYMFTLSPSHSLPAHTHTHTHSCSFRLPVPPSIKRGLPPCPGMAAFKARQETHIARMSAWLRLPNGSSPVFHSTDTYAEACPALKEDPYLKSYQDHNDPGQRFAPAIRSDWRTSESANAERAAEQARKKHHRRRIGRTL